MKETEMMAKGAITSSPIAAEGAINELVGIKTHELHGEHVSFGYTTDIAGMEAAQHVTNEMMQAVSDFTEAVLGQANKFPALAYSIAKRDVEDAKRWEQ